MIDRRSPVVTATAAGPTGEQKDGEKEWGAVREGKAEHGQMSGAEVLLSLISPASLYSASLFFLLNVSPPIHSSPPLCASPPLSMQGL